MRQDFSRTTLAQFTQRRNLLKLASAASVGALPLWAGSQTQTLSASQALASLAGRFPFALGVASGAPRSDSLVLWTRLATRNNTSRGEVVTRLDIPQARIPVRWEIAEDLGFAKVLARGEALALPELGHSLHIEVKNLRAGSQYFYRFILGDAVSAIGRTQTAPAADTLVSNLRLVLGSCQHWEQGLYAAWRHAAADNPDLVVFVGDYIYEYGPANGARPRYHDSSEVFSLDQYRDRYTLYKSDADLQEAHRVAPWLVTWDDHEVANDYANDRDERLSPDWMKRRAAAYQAYWENMPLPVAALNMASPEHMRIYDRFAWGRQASIYVLDDRQYRDHQTCSGSKRGGSATVWRDECPSMEDPNRSLLGKEQESWLNAGLAQERANWTVLAQQTLMAHTNQAMGAEYQRGRERYWTDGWNGYQPARERLLSGLRDAQDKGHASDTLVLGGDVHAWYLSDLQLQEQAKRLGERAPIIATELCGGSITSRSWPQEITDRVIRNNPHTRFGQSDLRGYTLIDLSDKQSSVSIRTLDDVVNPKARVSDFAKFVIEKGRPGIQKA